MFSNLETATKSSAKPGFELSARPTLSPHQARHLKRRLIVAYAEDRLSAAAVERAFEIFRELRGA
jgi:hypothetical protein